MALCLSLSLLQQLAAVSWYLLGGKTVQVVVMGALLRSEEMCLVQIFLQSGSAYNCVSELGELGLLEFRDLNPHLNLFQRKFVNEVRRCEELEKTFSFLEQEISRSLSPPLTEPLTVPSPAPSAPQPRELSVIEEESERLARELTEVSKNRDSLRSQLIQLSQYRRVLNRAYSFTESQVIPPPSPPSLDTSSLLDYGDDVHLSFVAGVVHPWKVSAFERLLWRACRGYIIADFQETEENLELPEMDEMVKWTVFLISYWGDNIGQKVKKICDCFHTNTFTYPESAEEGQKILVGLQTRIEDIKMVLSQTESYLQQLLSHCVSVLPQWKVCVGKCKAVHTVLNLCSPSVTDKCLIAEAWCPVRKLLLLQSALIEGTRRSASVVDSFYNRLPSSSSSSPPPTLFTTNSFTAAFQSIVEAYGVAKYREVNPAVYTMVTFPFLFAVMFGDVGHGLLMAAAALWMILQDNKNTPSRNEMWRMVYAGRYLILLMGLFSVYTGAIYNDCFSRGLSTFPSGWHLRPMNWSDETLRGSQYLSLDPNIAGVFQGPYPFGIDPIWHLASNHLSFLNSYKMKMSIIIGVVHITFGVCLSYFNYRHRGQWVSVFLVLIPELVFMMGLFGYLVFLIIYKWLVYGPGQSDRAPSILLHFINMLLFTDSKDSLPLYPGQWIVQRVVIVMVLASVPVLLVGKPLYLCYSHRGQSTATDQSAVTDTSSINAMLGDLEGGRRQQQEEEEEEEEEEFDAVEVFMHQAIHTIEYCLGCISNTASYLRLWALSLAHAQLSDVLWVMVMHISLSWRGMLGSVVLVLIFSLFASLTVSILLVMEGMSAFLHALRLHWVEFQGKFYSGTGYKFSPFSFSSITNSLILKAAPPAAPPPSSSRSGRSVWTQQCLRHTNLRLCSELSTDGPFPHKMMWSVVILLAAAFSVESYTVHDHERLAHGRQLKIFLSKNAEKLEFTPADDPSKTFLYWEKGRLRMSKGRVSGTGSDRRWYIDKVTYEDQGTYIQRDFWNKEISTFKVAVTPRHNYVKCVAGESLYISLEGIDLADASLSFSGEAANVTLVRDGARMSQDLVDYWDRVQTHSMNIEIRNVNFSDQGHYILRNRRDRVVSVTRMDLTDHHEYTGGNPLMALLLLLGIPAGICCCCRKKIFKKKANTAATLQTLPSTGPVGPSPPYSGPGQPGAVYYPGPNPNMGPTVHPPPPTAGPGQWTGPPPSPGIIPAYPPYNPAYPPAGPAMIPPGQPPQWNNPPPGQYPPGPVAPMGYAPAPVMYSSAPPEAASEPVKEEVKMENMASSPADPLLSAAPQASSPVAPVPPSSTNTLSSSDAPYQFKIDGKDSSTNFL